MTQKDNINELRTNYNIMLEYLIEQYNLKHDTLVSMTESVHNEIESEKAEKILRQIGFLK